MGFQVDTVAVPVSVAAGAEVAVNPRSGVIFSLGGTFVATVKFQYSPLATGDFWFDLPQGPGALTAAGFRRLAPGLARRVRANTTAYTSGTPTARAMSDDCMERVTGERAMQESTMALLVGSVNNTALQLPEPGLNCAVHVAGMAAGTVQLQFSMDNSVWHSWGPLLSAAGVVFLPAGMAAYVRLVGTSLTTATALTATCVAGLAMNEDNQLSYNRVPEGSIETVVSGALSLYTEISLISVTATVAYTLAAGLYDGQRKQLVVTVAASTPDGTLTPAVMAGGTSLDLDAVNEMAELIYFAATGWRVLNLTGATINP